MLKTPDMHLWEKIKKSVMVLNSDKRKESLPPRLRVRRVNVSLLSTSLDLHQMTLDEAYQQTKRFVEQHFQFGTKQVLIITGKGHNQKGVIHSEFMGWLETPFFQQCVRQARWTNDGGAVEIWLKKNK